jgi:hypothetical protein
MRLVELIRRSDAARALPGASPDVEFERSVCDRLYGDRAQVTATPLARGAAPLGRLVGGRYRLVERFGAGGMAIVLGAVAYRLLLGPQVPPADPGRTAPLPTAVRRMPSLSEARPGLPRGLYEAVHQALAPDPDARQESVAQFRAQLLDGHAPSRGLWRGGVVPFPDAVRSQIRSAA